MSYETNRYKELQKKLDTLQLAKVQYSQKLDTINNSIRQLEILMRQERDRTKRLGLGDKST